MPNKDYPESGNFTYTVGHWTMQRTSPLIIGISLFLSACSSTGVIPVGANSYMLSKQTATGYQTAVGITAEVMQEAAAYCSKSGK